MTQCFLCEPDIRYLESDIENLMDEASLFAFMASVAHRSASRVAVVSPHYTLYYTFTTGATSAMQNVFGDYDNFDVLIIPCYFPSHYAVAIYERGSGVVRFFDPMPHENRLTNRYKRCLKQAVVQLGGEMDEELVEILTETGTYNVQRDSVNCGFHACLIVESYLFNNKRTCLEALNIREERRRILQHLRQLLVSDDDFPYVPRPINPGRETGAAVEQKADEEEDIEQGGIFGKMKAFAESLEFQKRGGPHFHMLLATDALKTAEIVDEYICAEFPELPPEADSSPEVDQQRLYHELVGTHVIHRCTNNAPCMVNGKCSKGFPKPFSNHTVLFDDKPALYRRRSPADGGQTYSKRVGTGNQRATIVYDNSHVVPHNKYLLMKYRTHINIESLYGRQGMKYALKYPFKGSSWAYVRLNEQQPEEEGGLRIVHYDDLVRYFKCVYRSPHEAWMRMNQYPFVRMSHTVHKIPIHFPDQRPIYFVPGEERQAAEAYQRGGLKDTQLLAWMRTNREDPAARAYTILEFMQWYRFDKKGGAWHRRKRTGKN